MSAKIVEGPVRTLWAQVDANDTTGDIVYVGQIVEAASDGVRTIGAAAGAADTTGKAVPFGIVLATNNSTPVLNTTYNTETITTPANIAQANLTARTFNGVEGPNPKNDSAYYVQIQVIFPESVIRMPIYNGAYGTAPSVQTITTRQTNGMITAETWSSPDAASFLTDQSTIYMRSGLNRGLYRIGVNTTNTAPQVDIPFPYDNTTSDTGIQVPVRMVGPSKVQFDSEAMYIDCSATYGTNYYWIDVIKLDLSESGNEHVEFKFGFDHFCKARA